jgi:hypothetical protein
MSIFAILLTSLLEQRKLLDKLRGFFWQYLEIYVEYFTSRPINSGRQLRLIYLFAAIPIVAVLLGIKFLLFKHHLIQDLLNLFLFILSVQILTWKNEAKDEQTADKRSFVTTYAVRFFVPLFWFVVLPSAIGSICYLLIVCISSNLKAKNIDLMIYNVVVDKMLFYANIIPYTILFIFIALAGDFEEVTHYILGQKSNLSKSFYFLENMLNEIVLIAIGKVKFKVGANVIEADEIEAVKLEEEHFSKEITAYIVAVLYRAGLFFIGVIALVCIAKLF